MADILNVPAQTTGANAPNSGQVPNGQVTEIDASRDVNRVQINPAEAAQAASQGDRPAWLPQKFQSGDDLVKATVELLKKQGASETMIKLAEKQGASEDIAALYSDLEKAQSRGTQQQTQKLDPKTTTEAQAIEAVEKAGLKFNEFVQEFQSNGKLTDESYAKLEKAGFSRDDVDAWIDGQSALRDQKLNEVFTLAGGSAESYAEVAQWAAQNLPKAELEAYNAVMDAGDFNAIKMAVRGLYAQFAANGKEPSLLNGGTGKSGDEGDVYLSVVELRRDMADPRYKMGDKKFHQMVERKLARSNIL